MPQLDQMTFLSQYVAFAICFTLFYLILKKNFLSQIFVMLKIRRQIESQQKSEMNIGSITTPRPSKDLKSYLNHLTVSKMYLDTIFTWFSKWGLSFFYFCVLSKTRLKSKPSISTNLGRYQSCNAVSILKASLTSKSYFRYSGFFFCQIMMNLALHQKCCLSFYNLLLLSKTKKSLILEEKLFRIKQLRFFQK